MALIMTLVVGAIFVGCCILLIIIVATLIEFNRGNSEDKVGGASSALIAGFGVMFAAVAYWSGSWLFSVGNNTPNPRQEATEEYLGEWRSNAPSNILRALMSNNVRGCGEFHYKPSARHSGEYLVYCTQDGQNWTAYLVWPNVDRISGPARPDPRISPPR